MLQKGTDQTLHLIRPTFLPIYLLGYVGCQAAISELFSRDSSCWTLCSTSSTVYASISIDFRSDLLPERLLQLDIQLRKLHSLHIHH